MYSEFIQMLEDAQTHVNKSKGLDCVNTIIFFLNKNDISKAKACTVNEWDKISAYPLLAHLLHSFAFD